MSINPNLPPVPDGANVYVHPQQGKTIYVLSDGTMQVYKADGKRTTSSATPAKLAAGHGAWEHITDGVPQAVTPAPTPTVATTSYIAPQLAQEAALTGIQTYIQSQDYVLEQKLDGHRVMLVSPGGDLPPVPLTRNGQPYTRGLPTKVKAFRFPVDNGPGDFVLDGELVGDTFWVFDMPKSPATDEATPLRMRRFTLEQVFPFLVNGNEKIRLVPQAKSTEEKQALAAKAVASNFEGLIAKQRSAPYRAGGRTEEWLKLKFVTTADCIVSSVRDDGKDSVGLALVDPNVPKDLQLVSVGRASLIGKEKYGQIEVGDVLEVRYLYCGAGGRLYQPTILRKRTDKAMHECTIDQMKHVNKDVLGSLP